MKTAGNLNQSEHFIQKGLLSSLDQEKINNLIT